MSDEANKKVAHVISPSTLCILVIVFLGNISSIL